MLVNFKMDFSRSNQREGGQDLWCHDTRDGSRCLHKNPDSEASSLFPCPETLRIPFLLRVDDKSLSSSHARDSLCSRRSHPRNVRRNRDLLPFFTFAFVKTSDLLIVAESLPEKLDRFLEQLNRVAWLDWILIHAIYWLEALVNVLGRWRDKNKGTKEKDITVDRSFSRSGSISEEEEEEKMKLGDEGKKTTYKEALQRGSSGEDGGGSTGRSSSSRGDPILELFETGWIQNPMKRSCRSADSLTCLQNHDLRSFKFL